MLESRQSVKGQFDRWENHGDVIPRVTNQPDDLKTCVPINNNEIDNDPVSMTVINV